MSLLKKENKVHFRLYNLIMSNFDKIEKNNKR